MSYLLDTDTCSAYLKERGPATSRVMQYFGRIHLSVVTVGELYVWVLRKKTSPKRIVGLEKLLDGVAVIDLDLEIARKFGELRAGLLDRGRPTQVMDLLIASTALVHDLTLVTHNMQDFSEIPDLSLVDWLAE